MKTNNETYVQSLRPWQRRGIIVLGALIGGASVYSLLRWLSRRKKAAASDAALPKQPGTGESAV